MPNAPQRPDDPPPLLQQIAANLWEHWTKSPAPGTYPRYVFGFWGGAVVLFALAYAAMLGDSSDGRFQRDNAVGATANAIEQIRDYTVLIRPGELMIVGMLMIVAGRLAQIRDAVREKQ